MTETKSNHSDAPLRAVNMAVMDSMNQTVAMCHQPFYRRGDKLNADPAETARANAKLFAASPKLLAACKGMVEAYATCECIDANHPGHCPWCIARAAITEAEA